MMNEVVLNFSEEILLPFNTIWKDIIMLYCVSPWGIIGFPWEAGSDTISSITSVFASPNGVYLITDGKHLMHYNDYGLRLMSPCIKEGLYQVLGSSDFSRHKMYDYVFVVGKNLLMTDSFPDRKFRRINNYTNGQDRIASISQHFLFDENRGGIQTNIVTERGELTLISGERKESFSVPEVRRDIAIGGGHYWTLLKNGSLLSRCKAFESTIELPGNPFIFDFWANENIVWIASEKGKLFHVVYDQQKYRDTEIQLPTEQDFTHIMGNAPDKLFAVTKDRTEIFHYDGNAWHHITEKLFHKQLQTTELNGVSVFPPLFI